MKTEAVLRKVQYDFPADGTIVVGLSGGADSTLLTHLLLERYGLLKCSPQELAAVDPAVIHGKRVGEYGAEALVDRDEAPRGLLVERPTLEDIILYLAKEEVR